MLCSHQYVNMQTAYQCTDLINQSLFVSGNKNPYLKGLIAITAPLIRFRPWHYINLFTYLLTYVDS